MPLPVHQLLDPACALKPAWAVFDRGWYLSQYADARVLCSGQDEDAARLYYLRVGVRLGHAPNPYFDEAFYLARNPDIAALVQAGAYASGFDHFCQYGHRGVSPHWLFDDALYAALCEDMALDYLDLHHCHGRYDHYLKSGQFERRIAHFLFDGAYSREHAVMAGIAAEDIDAAGPYTHFLHRPGDARSRPSAYFDSAW